MCDTVVAAPESTADGVLLFGKNSDRQRNEAQAVELHAAAEHPIGRELKCTYITIPQVPRTQAVLLCRPFWTWGAEMGANEHGVVVGNEAVHARTAASEEQALIGMDLIRLGLERARTAAEAVEVIVSLLERYGQGGNCGHLTPTYYNNGFLIADPNEAFVLETLGKHWLVETVRGVRAISNGYSIGRDASRVSAGLPALLQTLGWTADANPDYAQVMANPDREHIGNAAARRACSTSLLKASEGRLTAWDIKNLLRDHGHGGQHEPNWREECAVRRTVCMHAGADARPSQTVGSFVSELHRQGAVHWVTGTAAPCISIFKPVLLDVPLPIQEPTPTDKFDPRALWWRHEQLHRRSILGDFASFVAGIRAERDALEAEFRARVLAVLDSENKTERSKVIAECWKEAAAMEDRWRAQLMSAPFSPVSDYAESWLRMNQLAGVPSFHNSVTE